MRKTGKVTLVAVAVLSIGLAGCTGSSGTPGAGTSAGASGAPSGGPSTGAPSGGSAGSAASCLVGAWKATGITGTLSGAVNGTVQGGGGLQLTVAADGKTMVNFDPMQPVAFTLTVAGGAVKGSFSYGGQLNGAIKTPSASATSGTWEPTGTVDFKSVTITADLTSPASVRVADKLPITDFVGSGTADTGAAIDSQPILKKATYQCGTDSLTLGPPSGGPDTGTWTFTKA